MQVLGNETRTGALNLVGAGLQGLVGQGLGDDGGVFGFDGDGLEGGFAGFDDFVAAGDRAAGTHGGDQNMHFAGGIVPDFFRGGFSMGVRIGRRRAEYPLCRRYRPRFLRRWFCDGRPDWRDCRTAVESRNWGFPWPVARPWRWRPSCPRCRGSKPVWRRAWPGGCAARGTWFLAW